MEDKICHYNHELIPSNKFKGDLLYLRFYTKKGDTLQYSEIAGTSATCTKILQCVVFFVSIICDQKGN